MTEGRLSTKVALRDSDRAGRGDVALRIPKTRRADDVGGSREVELKFSLPIGAVPAAARAAIAAGARRIGQSKSLLSSYFDTPDRSLRRAGYSLRIRRDGHAAVQTVKTIGPDGDGPGRGEWEAGIEGSRPVIDKRHTPTLLRPLKKRKVGRKLKPVFTVDVHRDTYLLDRGETMIEIAIDTGVVRHKRSEMAVSEVELELKSGEPGALFALARDIASAVPLMPTLTSKGERGYRLEAGTAHRPITSIAFDLRRGMTTLQAARSIGHACLSALFDNLDLLASTGSVDAVHQSRVCVRRLRAVLSLFKPALGWNDEAAVQAELKWLAERLGQVRELDVVAKLVRASAPEAGRDAPGFPSLITAVQARRDAACARVAETLRSRRLFDLSLDLVARIDGLSPADGVGGALARRRSMPIGRFAQKAIERRLSSLREDSQAIGGMEAKQQHRIRVRAKKLRYMIEPFRRLIATKRYCAAIDGLQDIQDALGDLNDGRTNSEIILVLIRNPEGGIIDKGESYFAAGLIAAGSRGLEATALSQARRAVAKLAGVRSLRMG